MTMICMNFLQLVLRLVKPTCALPAHFSPGYKTAQFDRIQQSIESDLTGKLESTSGSSVLKSPHFTTSFILLILLQLKGCFVMTSVLKSLGHQRVLFIGTLGLCFFLAVGVEGYFGTRYGKREPTAELMDGLGRFSSGRMGGPRSIVARSTGARFYAGTRYAGKRSYWDTPFNEGEGDRAMRVRDPIDCVYLSYFGVRCSRNDEIGWGAQKWNAGNNNEEAEEAPSANSETTGTSNA